MGLIIKPKSKLRALQCRLLTWESLKLVYCGEPISIEWANISKIFVPKNQEKELFAVYYSANGLDTAISFHASEADNTEALQKFMQENPDKIMTGKYSLFSHQMFSQMKLHYKYGAFYEKFLLGLLALTFMFFQLKYFGSLMIQKYQFLIKASCNEKCAEMLWSATIFWVWGLCLVLSLLLPFIFHKKIFNSVLKSKNVQVVNASMLAMYLAALGIVFSFSPITMIHATTKYSKVLAAYADGSLQAKLSQKVEMASKRAFQGDVDDTEEVEILEDQHEE